MQTEGKSVPEEWRIVVARKDRNLVRRCHEQLLRSSCSEYSDNVGSILVRVLVFS